MGIFSRFRKAASARADAAVKKAMDPKKELELAIQQLEDQRQDALKELLSFKTTSKQIEKDIAEKQARVPVLEQKAMAAVKGGNDEQARKFLREKREIETELIKARQDQDEAARYALELNRSRKTLETRLQALKLKKGTLATQLAAARSGRATPLGNDPELFEKFDKAADGIDDDAIAAEVMTEMSDGASVSDGWVIDGDDALAELKAKMAADKKPKLPSGEGE